MGDLFRMIESMKKRYALTACEGSLLHDVRMFGNDGVHQSTTEINQAYLEETLVMLASYDNFKQAFKAANKERKGELKEQEKEEKRRREFEAQKEKAKARKENKKQQELKAQEVKAAKRKEAPSSTSS